MDREALLLGATHTSQEHAVELREGTQHDPVSPHAFMSHKNIDYRSLLNENKHNCHIGSSVFNTISRGADVLLLITAKENVSYNALCIL